MPVSAGRTSPRFPACTLPRARRAHCRFGGRPEGLRTSKSESLLPGRGVTVRAGQVMLSPLTPWLWVTPGRTHSPPVSKCSENASRLRGPPPAEGAVSSQHGAQPSIRPSCYCEPVPCCPASPPPSSSPLQALLHKDAPHADRHRVQVRLSPLLVSVRLRISSDSLRTLFKDYDFGRDTAVTKLVALW